MKCTILGFTLMFSMLLNGQNISLQNITIEPNLGLQNYEHFKRLVLVSNNSEAEHIQNFKFDWGYKYELSVKVIKLIPELSDGTKYDFELDKIISKTKVSDSSQFDLFIDPLVYYQNSGIDDADINNSLKLVSDSVYLYLDAVEIEIPTDLLFTFNRIVKSEFGKMGQFIFVNKNRIRLININ